MKTIRGKLAILRSTAHLTGLFGQAIAIGLGSSAESAASTRLDHEVARIPVDFVGVDEVNSQIIFKGTLPDYLSAKYSEVGLINNQADDAAGGFGSLQIFSSVESEGWALGTGAAFETTHARVGGQAVTLRPAASATATATLARTLDLSGYSSADQFNLSFTSNNAFASTVQIRFYTDASNYYTVAFTPVTAGTRIVAVNKGAATVTGTPSWANITSVEARTTATAGGAAEVAFDSLRIEDVDTLSPLYTLVERKVVSVVTKDPGRPRDIEIAVVVTL